jgi:hypothetical protein
MVRLALPLLLVRSTFTDAASSRERRLNKKLVSKLPLKPWVNNKVGAPTTSPGA